MFSHDVTAAILAKQWNADHIGWPPKYHVGVWDLNSFLTGVNTFFVPINLHGCCPPEWKTRIHSGCKYFLFTSPSCPCRKHHSNESQTWESEFKQFPSLMTILQLWCTWVTRQDRVKRRTSREPNLPFGNDSITRERLFESNVELYSVEPNCLQNKQRKWSSLSAFFKVKSKWRLQTFDNAFGSLQVKIGVWPKVGLQALVAPGLAWRTPQPL